MALRFGLGLVALALVVGGCGSDGNQSLISTTGGPGGTNADGGGGDGGSTGGSNDANSSGNNTGTNNTGTSTSNSSGCPDVTVDADRAIPDMLIVLDRSGSMNEDDGLPTTRWLGSVDALKQVTSQLDDVISFGLMTFPGTADPSVPDCMGVSDVDQCLACASPLTNYCEGFAGQLACAIQGLSCGGIDKGSCDACSAALSQAGAQCEPAGLDVPIDLNQSGPIATVLDAMRPNGSTPTSASLLAARDVLAARDTDLMSGEFDVTSKYVLLVTDGEPKCDGSDADSEAATIAAVEALAADGVRVYVVGYNTAGTNGGAVLDMAAAVGGTGDTMHRSVSDGAELIAELRTIAGSAASCSFVLATAQDWRYIDVTVDGELVAYDKDGLEGWSLRDDGQTVDLNGATCDALQAGAVVRAKVNCNPVRLD